MDYGYESGLLLKILLEPSTLMSVDLAPEEFSNENYRMVYRAILDLTNEGRIVDFGPVVERLTQQAPGNWLHFVSSMAAEAQPPTSVTASVEAIRRIHQSTRAITVAARLSERSAMPGAVDDAIRDLMGLTQTKSRHEHTMSSALKLALADIEEAVEGRRRGLPTGLKDLDEKLGGLHGGDLIVIGARPAMGKTALMLNMLLASTRHGTPVGVFTSEQDASQAAQRMIAIEGKVPLVAMRNGKLGDSDWSSVSAAVQTMNKYSVQLDDTGSPSLSHIVRTARRWKHTHGTGALFIDYLQRMDCESGKKRFESVGDNVRGLKTLAKELDIPVVVLSQVGRQVESRQDKRPNMGDLSDSSEVEKEADQVFMLYRDEVYNEDTPDKGIAEILIEKNRHGPTGYIRVSWRGEFLRFDDLARGYDYAAR